MGRFLKEIIADAIITERDSQLSSLRLVTEGTIGEICGVITSIALPFAVIEFSTQSPRIGQDAMAFTCDIPTSFFSRKRAFQIPHHTAQSCRSNHIGQPAA